jgi:hypothetical protein
MLIDPERNPRALGRGELDVGATVVSALQSSYHVCRSVARIRCSRINLSG